MPAESIDLWWSLLLGSNPGGNGDPIVFTPLAGASANAQWVGQQALATAYAAGGLGLLLVLRGVLLALTVALAEGLAVGSGASLQQAGRAGWLALPLLIAGAALRPQLFALPLFGLVLLLGGPLVGRRGVRPAVVGATVLWSNLHGSFVLAPVGLLLFALGSRPPIARERLRLAALSAAATLVNPWGVGLAADIFQVFQTNQAGGNGGVALEWRPLELGSPFGGFFLLLVISALVGLLRVGHRHAAHLATLALPLALLTLVGARHSTWFALAATPLAAHGLGRVGLPTPGKAAVNGLLLAMLAALAIVGLARPALGASRQVALDTPVELANQLGQFQHDRIFGYSDWGGYLAWQLRPSGRVFVDDRFEQHPPEVWSAYRRVSLAEPGWDALLDQTGVQALALDARMQAPLVEAATSSENWQRVYADPRSVLFIRR